MGTVVLEADYGRRVKPRSVAVVTGGATFVSCTRMLLPCGSIEVKGSAMHSRASASTYGGDDGTRTLGLCRESTPFVRN